MPTNINRALDSKRYGNNCSKCPTDYDPAAKIFLYFIFNNPSLLVSAIHREDKLQTL
jgi:hypothetical protein